ncbi:GNAT family N-acetyltransferase [Pyruvatibacter sp.]|uniref:GNAT family N-acetyltransferase n=1 Tax=Pyruvatibacter sp. TaxID=1981328 RepID=UPI0032EBCBEF
MENQGRALNITLLQSPFAPKHLAGFTRLSGDVFGADASEEWLASLAWRLESMPDVTVFIAERDGAPVGFKAGYATALRRYYSWLGGVVPSARRQGIARALMREQHRWITASRFNHVECHVEQKNRAMIEANLKAGFVVAGFFLKDNKPYAIMQKEMPADPADYAGSREKIASRLVMFMPCFT